MGQLTTCETCASKKNLANENESNKIPENFDKLTSSQHVPINNSLLKSQTPNNIPNQNIHNSVNVSTNLADGNNNQSPIKNSNIDNINNVNNNVSSLKHSINQNSVSQAPPVMETPVSLKVSNAIMNNSTKMVSSVNYRCIKSFQCHNDIIVSLIELSNGNIATGSYDTTISIWDINNDNPLLSIPTSGKVICLLEFKPGILLCGTDNKEIEMWTINGKDTNHVTTFQGHLLWVNCLTKCNDDFFASGSNDSDIRIWNYSEQKAYNVLQGHDDCVLALITLKDGKLCSGSVDLTIKIWDWENGTCISTMKGHQSWVKCLYQLLNGYIASGGDDKTIKIWNNNSCIKTLYGHKKSVRIICQISENLIVSGSFDKTIKIWDINKNCCIQTLDEYSSKVICLLLHSSGLLISAYNDRTIKIWKNQ